MNFFSPIARFFETEQREIDATADGVEANLRTAVGNLDGARVGLRDAEFEVEDGMRLLPPGTTPALDDYGLRADARLPWETRRGLVQAADRAERVEGSRTVAETRNLLDDTQRQYEAALARARASDPDGGRLDTSRLTNLAERHAEVRGTVDEIGPRASRIARRVRGERGTRM